MINRESGRVQLGAAGGSAKRSRETHTQELKTVNLWSGAHGLPTRAEASPSSWSTRQREKRESSALKLTTLHPPKSWMPQTISKPPLL